MLKMISHIFQYFVSIKCTYKFQNQLYPFSANHFIEPLVRVKFNILHVRIRDIISARIYQKK